MTTSGGRSWTEISQDLSRKTWDVPGSVGKYRETETARPTQRGVIYTVAPSYVDINTIWAGTDDGLIHVTRNGGKTWTDVTPPDLKPFMKVSLSDAGHTDALTAYAAVNTLRLDDMPPHIYRTHDGGRTWTHITNGIPDGGTINALREDPHPTHQSLQEALAVIAKCRRKRRLMSASMANALYTSSPTGSDSALAPTSNARVRRVQG